VAGSYPEARLLWNLGFYGDWLSQGQSFSTYDRQIVGRLAWLPAFRERTRLHLGMSLRYGKPDEGVLRLRSRPENFIAPYFVETDTFPADNTKMVAVEAYYRPGPLLIGSEYFVQKVKAPESGDPVFHGGDAVVSWLLTARRARTTREADSSIRCPRHAPCSRADLALGARRTRFVHRPRRRFGARRSILEDHTDVQLVSLGSAATRDRVWLRASGSLQPAWRESLLSNACSGTDLRDFAPRPSGESELAGCKIVFELDRRPR
jgi:hypothetical protein